MLRGALMNAAGSERVRRLSRDSLSKWLYVGLHIKRWLALLAIAVAIMGIGFAYPLREVYASSTFPPWAYYLTLPFIHRTRDRGPKVVAIGGGTGLSNLLRGLKQYTSNLTAIVTVADDGGSSGRLRRDMGVIPPGDIRACIAALADSEPLVTALFPY